MRITSQTVENGYYRSRLTVGNVTSKDNGKYCCLAESFNSIKTACHDVNVQGEQSVQFYLVKISNFGDIRMFDSRWSSGSDAKGNDGGSCTC